MTPRPNVLFIITDQHRPDHTGFGGNPLLETPHLDALAARSMRFDRAIVANPICMPNRSSIVTGRVPSAHGTRMNGIPLDWSANTFPRALRERGYDTAYIGKCHLQNMGQGAANMRELWKDEPAGDPRSDPHPAGWDQWEIRDRYGKGPVVFPPDYYGFGEVDLAIGHGDFCSGQYLEWLIENGIELEKLRGPRNGLPYESSWFQVWRTALPTEFYPTSYVTMRTVEFLERRAGVAEPFLAFCSYPDPHHPFAPPGAYFDRYRPEDVTLSPTFGDPHSDSMPHYKKMIENRGTPAHPVYGWAPTEAQLREAAAAEYGMISLIDDGVGEVLAALARSGHADNTIVVFTSDHGDMFGDHGVLLKHAMHYDGCLRVPLLIDSPGRSAGVSGSLVSSLDLAQTLLELTRTPEFMGMQGTSLVPLLDDPSGSVRDHVLVEEDEPYDVLGNGHSLRMTTLVTEGARFTLYDGSDHGELFDLENDPDEMTNLFARPEGRDLRAHLAERLARHLISYGDHGRRPANTA